MLLIMDFLRHVRKRFLVVTNVRNVKETLLQKIYISLVLTKVALQSRLLVQF